MRQRLSSGVGETEAHMSIHWDMVPASQITDIAFNKIQWVRFVSSSLFFWWWWGACVCWGGGGGLVQGHVD